ncbi:MAG: TerC/Alx family metal homeostasis membrane protein [Edaphobacter sp.]|uniref:TerC/Alx family metal homeostasis membrane protein n=1 Tax=Edaphobacter sp. TaxID=1934404 RepID=UPI002390BC69|nr:TerC/Alx family metal homeostasis membrane protein [Edaphobacter sp.]MDE1176048.1 TerC/Alx family metal homeostasis membrane protein [Edaphobacter sp.]
MPLATPTGYWVGFHLFVFALMALEYFYVRAQRQRYGAAQVLHSTSVAATCLWIGAALGFGLFLYRAMGGEAATQYLAGYAIEEALSIDNLFVFLLLFRVFRVTEASQPLVLFWGVVGAIVMRGSFIAAGIGLMSRFEWVSYIFAVVLLIASVKLVLPEKESTTEELPGWLKWIARLHPVSLRQDKFLVRENGHRMMTVLCLALVAIEVTDLVFAIDSIPAVLSITRHPLLAYTSNIMAVMGLRSLYFLLAQLLKQLVFLHYGLAAVLAFAAVKMLIAHIYEIRPLMSLAIVITMLAITILASLAKRPVKAA